MATSGKSSPSRHSSSSLQSTDSPEMDLVILEPLGLDIGMRYRDDVLALRAEKEDDVHRAYRHQSYRSYILHEYDRLTRGDRRVIPSCVVWKVREKFPSMDGQYQGFVPSL